jgi:hypothetical protein
VECVDEILVAVEMQLILAGLYQPNPAWPGPGVSRWLLPDKPRLKGLLADAIVQADGNEAFQEICRDAGASRNPFWAFRHYMSAESLKILLMKLEEKYHAHPPRPPAPGRPD